MIHSRYFIPFSVLVLFFLTACGGESNSSDSESYTVKGRYLSTDLSGSSISVVHETVQDVMNSMRMSFRIADEPVVDDLEMGDIIQFDMVLTDAGWFARNITVLPDDTELDLPEELQGIGIQP